MSLDHERIEELLAGYSLLSLSGEDAAEADRLLADHVPSCPPCRQMVADFQALAGDLALGAGPVPPPELLLPRIRRGIEEVPLGRRRSPRGSWLAVAASVLALVAMGGLSFTMASRASNAEDARNLAIELLSLMRSPGVDPVNLDPEGDSPSAAGFVGISAPDIRRFYLVAEFCPEPRPGYAYQLWLGADGRFTPVGEMFAPNGGTVLIGLTIDVARFDAVWITEEVAGSAPSVPSTQGRSWRADLA